MSPVTELVLATLKPEVDLALLGESNDLLLRHPGCSRIRTSILRDDPRRILLFIDWDSIEARQWQDFASSDAFRRFGSNVARLIESSGTTSVCHVAFSPASPAVLSPGESKAAVADVVYVYFAGDPALALSSEAVEGVVKTVRCSYAEAKASVEQANGDFAMGWTAETNLDFEGDRCRALVGVVGWKSPDDHRRAGGMRFVQRLTAALRDLPELKGITRLVAYPP
ncbi:hypothetical protein F4780DRAFT_475683 [Xylariomycetidae sp. FL0641]|nr:hypothetical protein F4780DRAFT_475683 [Xylariomycetidae sp. FL0641]